MFRDFTRRGEEVRIYAQDGRPPFTIHGAIKNDEGWNHNKWTPEGKYFEDDEENNENDLIVLIKRCPFCGSLDAPTISKYDKATGCKEEKGDSGFVVICDHNKNGCGASSGWGRYVESVVRKWERRV